MGIVRIWSVASTQCHEGAAIGEKETERTWTAILENTVKPFRQYRGIVVRINSNRDTLQEYINGQFGLHGTNHVSRVQAA